MSETNPPGASIRCSHSDMEYHLNNIRFGNTNIHYLEITARCKKCYAPIAFRGVPVGISPDHPTASLDGTEIRLPFLAKGEEHDGNGIGYRVTVHEP